MAGGIFKDEHGRLFPRLSKTFIRAFIFAIFVFALLANTFYSFGKDSAVEEKFGSEYLNKIVIVDENDKEVIYEKVKDGE